MFNFTTTNVINSNNDLSTGKTLWSAQEEKDGKPASFHVKRVNNFLAPNVVAIYKATAVDPELAKVCINLEGLGAKSGDTFRLAVYIGLTQASQDSRYSNDMILKGKPFAVDFVWTGIDAEKMAEKLVKTIKKYEIMVYGDKLLNVSQSGSYITIEAVNEYQRFKTVNIEKFDEEAHFGMGEYNVVKSLEDLTEVDSNAKVTGTAENYFVGKEGFGTYSFLLHNLRLPTSARTRAFGINQEETPIVGAKYNQYTIHYCAKRGILGMNAVGDVTKSLTTHVFYVNQALADDFEAALEIIAPEAGIIDVPKKATVGDDDSEIGG